MSLFLGWASAPPLVGIGQLHAPALQPFAQQHFDLRVDAAKFGRSAAFQRLVQRRVQPQGKSLARGDIVLRHDLRLLVEGACIDHRLGVALAAQDHHQVADHGGATLVIQLDHILGR